MSNEAAAPAGQIKKLYIRDTVLFAIQHIPTIDQPTLEKFLELVNTTGTFGGMTHDQVLLKMHQTLKYVPNSCAKSLLILADLLEIDLPVGWDLASSLAATPSFKSLPGPVTAAQPRLPAYEAR